MPVIIDSVKLGEKTKNRFEKSAHGADIVGSLIKGTVTTKTEKFREALKYFFSF